MTATGRATPGRSHLLARVLPVLLASGCAAAAPSPTPADTQVIFEELARRGATVTGMVGGDPGCDEPELVDNAVSFELLGPEQARPVRVHLFIFRNAAAYEAAAGAFGDCYRSKASLAGSDVARIDLSPYRVLAEGLPDDDRRLIEEAIEALR